MEAVEKKLYEAMFLVDSGKAAADWDGTIKVIETIMNRADAEVVSMRKWSERRLAYEIDHKSRGTYILCYFKANGERIAGLEKDVQLSEEIIRVLVLSTEGRPQEMIDSDIKGEKEAPGELPDRSDASYTGRESFRSSSPRRPRHTDDNDSGNTPSNEDQKEGTSEQETGE